MEVLSTQNVATIPTLEIPDRLKRIQHQLADFIPYAGSCYVVLWSEEDEIIILRQNHGGIKPSYSSIDVDTLEYIFTRYLSRIEKDVVVC